MVMWLIPLTADVAKAVTANKGGTYTGSGLTNDTKVTSQISGNGRNYHALWYNLHKIH